jgi:hypothetical protein
MHLDNGKVFMNSYLIGGEKTKNELAKKGRKSGTIFRGFKLKFNYVCY